MILKEEEISRSKEEAIANPHQIRDIKKAVKEGDVQTLQQKLTWGQMKFPPSRNLDNR
jgi:DNA sulfur modification protein DndC